MFGRFCSCPAAGAALRFCVPPAVEQAATSIATPKQVTVLAVARNVSVMQEIVTRNHEQPMSKRRLKMDFDGRPDLAQGRLEQPVRPSQTAP